LLFGSHLTGVSSVCLCVFCALFVFSMFYSCFLFCSLFLPSCAACHPNARAMRVFVDFCGSSASERCLCSPLGTMLVDDRPNALGNSVRACSCKNECGSPPFSSLLL
jgi:hypothetical protein